MMMIWRIATKVSQYVDYNNNNNNNNKDDDDDDIYGAVIMA